MRPRARAAGMHASMSSGRPTHSINAWYAATLGIGHRTKNVGRAQCLRRLEAGVVEIGHGHPFGAHAGAHAVVVRPTPPAPTTRT